MLTLCWVACAYYCLWPIDCHRSLHRLVRWVASLSTGYWLAYSLAYFLAYLLAQFLMVFVIYVEENVWIVWIVVLDYLDHFWAYGRCALSFGGLFTTYWPTVPCFDPCCSFDQPCRIDPSFPHSWQDSTNPVPFTSHFQVFCSTSSVPYVATAFHVWKFAGAHSCKKGECRELSHLALVIGWHGSVVSSVSWAQPFGISYWLARKCRELSVVSSLVIGWHGSAVSSVSWAQPFGISYWLARKCHELSVVSSAIWH